MLYKTLLASTLLFGALLPQALAEPGATSPHVETVKALFKTFNAHDAEGLSEFYTTDAAVYSPESCQPTIGPDEISAGYAEMFQYIPDVHDDLELVVADGNRVAVTFTASGTMEGEAFELPIAAFLLFENGKIKEDRVFFDTDIELNCD